MRNILPVLLFLLFFLMAVFVSPSIGPSWDEPDNIYAGGIYLTFFRHLDPSTFTKRDQSSYDQRIYAQDMTLSRYPPVSILVASAFTSLVETVRGQLSGAEIIGMFHITSGMFLGALVVFVYLWGLLLGLPTAYAVIAALIAGFLPTVFGHGLSNLKDTAQVALVTASLYSLVRSSIQKNRVWFIVGCVVWGLALATKFNAIYVPVIWGIWRILNIEGGITNFEGKKATRIHSLMHLMIDSVILLVVGITVMILVWPYLWFDPVIRLQEVIAYFTHVGTGYKVMFDGHPMYVGGDVGIWWYPIGYLLFSTPIPVLIVGVIGGIRVVREIWEGIRRGRGNRGRMIRGSILFIWLGVPLARVFFPYTAFYDGFRHFMEVLPVLALFASFGMFAISSVHSSGKNILFIILATGVVGHLIFITLFYFPYSTGYLNFLARDQNIAFDRDFSGLAVREGMDYLRSNYPGMRVMVPIGGHLSWYYVRPGHDVFVYTPADADAIIFVNKVSHSTKAELEAQLGGQFKLVYTIQRGESVFGWVYKRI